MIRVFSSEYGVTFNAKETVSICFCKNSTIVSSVIKTLKGALYRIWCGVNRLGDSGVKVV